MIVVRRLYSAEFANLSPSMSVLLFTLLHNLGVFMHQRLS